MQGVAVDGRGAVYACDVALAAVVRLDAAGRIERWCESAGGTPLIAPNWGAFAPDGSMWFSDSGTERVGACDGRLIRVPPGGGDGEPVDVGPLDFPNGLAVGEDGTVFLLESFTPRLSALRRAGLETLAELPGVVPDGVALTADGEFVVSCYYPFRILLVSRSGRRRLGADRRRAGNPPPDADQRGVLRRRAALAGDRVPGRFDDLRAGRDPLRRRAAAPADH